MASEVKGKQMRNGFIVGILVSCLFYAGIGDAPLAAEISQSDASTEICQNIEPAFTPTLISAEPTRNTLQFTPTPRSETSSPIVVAQCCRICKKGKACGNSCISRRYTCRKPPGCACDG
jgi:hypothetical protein